MAQPIIVSQGTTLEREKTAEKIIAEIFSDFDGDYKNHMDFKLYELADDKKLIAIEQVRDLIKEINIKPRISSKKIIWIKEAQSLSIEAQNALLKTLEESPDYAQIILTVDHIDNLIQTVLSRCIVKDLNLSSRVDIDSEEYIEAKSEFENILNMDVGKKIDWVTENKNKIKDRDATAILLDMWEVVLREKMLESINSSDADLYKDKIKLLQKVKRYISMNANSALAIEALLLNL
jgi:DNA polymerase-3 subunit delta'